MGETSTDESLVRYVESAVVSAIRLKRYWIKNGVDEEEALKRAIKQAEGMFEVSNLSKDQILEILDEIKNMAETLIEKLKEEE